MQRETLAKNYRVQQFTSSGTNGLCAKCQKLSEHFWVFFYLFTYFDVLYFCELFFLLTFKALRGQGLVSFASTLRQMSRRNRELNH